MFLFLGNTFSQKTIWTDVQESKLKQSSTRQIIPQKYRTVQLDLPTLKTTLAAAPERFTPAAAKLAPVVIELPMPDGSSQKFRIESAPIMEEPLAAKYPEIKTFTGWGVDDPTAFLKCDYTMKGFHAMVLSDQFGSWFVDPFAVGDTENYISYFKKDFTKADAQPWTCDADALAIDETQLVPDAKRGSSGDCVLRKYRLAMAATGEYSNFHGATGTNKAPALAAIVTTMNRVNGVYEKDLAITMMLIANTDLTIYTAGGSDPFSNGNGGTMLNQNVTNMSNVIGNANFDIGHVFSTGGGGIAGLGVVCGTSKARGVTGGAQPIGDPFDIDYVAHEMGHQFGANHTYNNCGGDGNAQSGMEPSSGSSIMAYAGICASNVQPNSDAYFHAYNLEEIGIYVTTQNGNSCPTKTVTTNKPPVLVDAGANKTIPKNTPFALTAIANDPDPNTSLTYCWEQMDPTLTAGPPTGTATSGPLFRSLFPNTSPTRYFPRLSDLVTNTNWTWEKLYNGTANRTLNFRVAVRDNFPGAGCTDEDDLVLTVAANSGPFLVSSPNTNVTWNVGASETVTWAVANTTAAPVSCANVKISLSTDGGFTYPIVLVENTPNDGSEPIVVPNNVSMTCRVKVEAVGNYFFDISNTNFKIQLPPVPTFLLAANPTKTTVCAAQTGSFNVDLTSILNFSNPVQISVSGLPAGATASASPNPATPGASTTVTLADFTPAMAGNYTLTISGVSGTTTQTTTLGLTVLPGKPTAVATPNNPADGANGQAQSIVLNWSQVQFADSYEIEIASNPSFSAGSTLYSGTVDTNFVGLTGFGLSTVYYWRVRGDNVCGDGDFSPVYAFQTGKEVCNQTFASTNVPVTIPDNAAGVFVSNLTVPANKIVTDVNLTLQINHTYVGDLLAGLTNAVGDTIFLFANPGVPATDFGCSGDNISATFDDEATATANDFENLCAATIPAIGGTFKPLEPLGFFDGKTAQGNWSLLVGDVFGEDGGAIQSWSLNFCFADPVVAGVLAKNTPLTVPSGGQRAIPTANLQAQASAAPNQITYVLLSLPTHGTLKLNGADLAIGGTFTQANIDANQLTYSNNGDGATADNFKFDFVDANNSAWLYNGVFQINVVQNTLAGSAAATAQILCNGDSNGQITVSATGGTAPLSYSLNGGAGQASNVFSGLAAGNYSVVVTDANGFTLTSGNISLSNPTKIGVSATVAADDLTAEGTGGTGVLTYSIDGQNFDSNPVFQDLANGNYTVTVRDANGCTATTTALVAVNMLLATLNVVQNIPCAGDAKGEIRVSAGGGQDPFVYSLNGANPQTSDVFSGLPAGDYTVVVTDGFGLTVETQKVTLTDPPVLTASASANLNVATVTASGGTGALAYSSDGGANFQQSNIFQNLANGDYTFIVRDANGCTATATSTIAVAALAGAAANTSAILCKGGGGTITASATGGIPPYEYKLDAGIFQSSEIFQNVAAGAHAVEIRDAAGTIFKIDLTLDEPTAVVAATSVFSNDLTASATGGTGSYTFGLSNGQTSTDGKFPNLPNGDYILTATDANGCTATASFTLNYTALSASVLTGNPKCAGEATGQFLVSAGGGTAPFQFSLDGVNFQNSAIFAGLAAGTYNIVVKDAAGDLFQINNVELTDPTALTATAAVAQSSVTVTAAGGTGVLTYSLDGGAFQTSKTFQNVAGGQHTVTVKDANGCTTSVQVTVLANTLTAAVEPVVLPCPPALPTFEICVNAGYPPYTYTVSPNIPSTLTGSALCDSRIVFADVKTGNYTVTITDSEGFVKTVNFNFAAQPVMTVGASAAGDDIVVAVTNGTPPFQYSLNGGANQNSNIFADQLNGDYSILVTDANGCTATATFKLNDAVEPSAAWGLSVAPNPSSGAFNIFLKNEQPATLEFSVFDAAGRRLRSFEIEKMSGELVRPLDLSDLPAGSYLLRVTDGRDVGAVRLSILR